MTGLRVGEALRLRLDDVDLDTGVLTVRGTKFGNHASTRDALARYRTRRTSHLCGRNAAHFFVTRTGNRLDGSDVRRTFYCQLSRQIRLRGMHDSHGPRLHDFRFAVGAASRKVAAGFACWSVWSGRTSGTGQTVLL